MTIKDRYLGLEFYGAFQFYTIPLAEKPIVIDPYFATTIELRTKEDGLRKRWYYTQDSNNPLESIEIELTEKGCGIARVTFSELSYPIDAEDVLKIYMKGVLLYEGIVDNDVDISNPVFTAAGRWNLLSELLFTGSYVTGETALNILEDLITGLTTISKIAWNASKVNLGSTPPSLAIDYIDDEAERIISDIVEACGTNYYWGVDATRDFFVKPYSDTPIVQKVYYSKDVSEFEKVKITEDYSKVQMTEAVVYLKEPVTGSMMKVGQVGNSGNATYPPLPVSYKLRKKIGKITASDSILVEPLPTDSAATISARVSAAMLFSLNWAYEKLKSMGNKSLKVSISNIDTSIYIPLPSTVVMVEGDFDKSMVVIVDCEVVTGWTNVTSVNSIGKDGNKAIKLFTAASDSTFDFERDVRYYKQKKVGFYCKAPIETEIEVAFTDKKGVYLPLVSDADDYSGSGNDGTPTDIIYSDTPDMKMYLPLVSDALDDSDFGNNGTPTDITWTGGFANFNGTSSKIVCGDISTKSGITDKFSISFKVRDDGSADWTKVLCFTSSAVAHRIEFDNNNNLKYYDNGANGFMESNKIICQSMTQGVFYNICIVADGANVKIYQGNVLINTVAQTGNLNASNLIVGSYQSGSTFAKMGFSNFYIFDSALTDAERAELYTSNIFLPLPRAVANFNGTSSKIVSSLSIPNLTGYSISFKFKRNGLPAGIEYILSNYADSNNNDLLRIDTNGKIYFGFKRTTSSNNLGTTNNLCDNVFHHIVLNIIDSTHAQFTVDGINGSIITFTIPITNLLSPVLYLGTQISSAYFTGILSDFYIFNRALTDAEKTELFLYNDPPAWFTENYPFKFAAADSNLGYYDFDVNHDFQYVIFTYVSGNIYVDDIQVFCETKRQVVVPIKKTKLTWNSEGIKCDVEGGNINNPETEQLEQMNSKIKILENIQDI